MYNCILVLNKNLRQAESKRKVKLNWQQVALMKQQKYYCKHAVLYKAVYGGKKKGKGHQNVLNVRPYLQKFFQIPEIKYVFNDTLKYLTAILTVWNVVLFYHQTVTVSSIFVTMKIE